MMNFLLCILSICLVGFMNLAMFLMILFECLINCILEFQMKDSLGLLTFELVNLLPMVMLFLLSIHTKHHLASLIFAIQHYYHFDYNQPFDFLDFLQFNN